MVKLRRRRTPADRVQEWAASEKPTAALAVVALAGAASALGGEYIRLLARRRHDKPEADPLLESVPAAAADTFGLAFEAYASASRSEATLFNLLGGFLGSFAVVRISTWGIKQQWWPAGNVKLKGRHIHHFVPGILLAFGSGVAALLARDERSAQRVALPMGIGMGLTFDEAALLLDLRDVYWNREGILSVQVSFGLVAIMSAAVLTARLVRRAEEHQEEIGAIPPRSRALPAATSTG